MTSGRKKERTDNVIQINFFYFMGEIADMMINGHLCAGCGSSFSPEYYEQNKGDKGFPVYCDDCWIEWGRQKDLSKESDFIK